VIVFSEITLEFEMMAEHGRMKLEDTILEGLLPKIVAKSKIDFEVNDSELKAICSLIVTS
jgi:hypothetical protein